MMHEDYILAILKQMIEAMMQGMYGAQDAAAMTIHDKVKEDMADQLIKKVDEGDVLNAIEQLAVMTAGKSQDDLIAGYLFYEYLLSKDEDWFDDNDLSYSEMFNEMRNYFVGFGMSEGLIDLLLMNV